MYINRGRYETFWECPRKYYWRFIKGIEGVKSVPELRIGAACHAFLEHWHKNFNYDEAIQAMKDDFGRTLNQIGPEIPLKEQVEDQLKATAELLCKDYRARYGDVDDPDFKVIDTELQGEAPLANGHILVFRIDALVSSEGKLWVGEHKTSKYLGERFLNSFLFNYQVIVYVYGASRVLNQPLAGAIINILRKPTPRTKADFYRQPVVVSREHMRGAVVSFTHTAEEILKRNPDDKDEWPQVTRGCADCPYMAICAYDANPVPPLYITRPDDYVDEARKLSDVTV